jgi:hypothetical protein
MCRFWRVKRIQMRSFWSKAVKMPSVYVPHPKVRGPPKCNDCGETDETKFYPYNRCAGKPCIACSRVRGIENRKRLTDRHHQVKLDRKECLVCKRLITPETVHHFEWNHRDPTTKVERLARLILKPKLYDEEVAKCDLLCLFCHADETRDQIKGGKLNTRPRKYE